MFEKKDKNIIVPKQNNVSTTNNSNKFLISALCLITVIATVFIFGKNQVSSTESNDNVSQTQEAITNSTIKNSLSSISDLAVLDINHTQFLEREDISTILGIKLSNSYSLLYDGEVKIGIDFKEIDVDVNSMKKTITLKLGTPKVISNDIDTDSFEYFDEKKGFFNKQKLEDFAILPELKKVTEEQLREDGCFEQALDMAKEVVTDLMSSIAPNYKVIIE